MNTGKTDVRHSNVSLSTLFRFLLVGGFATGLQYGLMTLLIIDFATQAVLASGIGFVTGAVANYWLNARLTFKTEQRHAVALPRFVVTALAGLAINSAILGFLTSVGIGLVIAQVVSTLCVLVWNYTINALWTFRTAKQ